MLVFLDVDGTLVGSSGTVSDEALEALDTLREFGARLVIATGQPAGEITREIAERLDASAPHIFLNGALVQTDRGRTVHEEPIATEALRPQIEASREWGEPLELYTASAIYVEELTPQSREHAEYVGMRPAERDLMEVAEEESVLKTQWIVEPGRSEAVLDLEMPDSVAEVATSPVMPDVAFITVTGEGVTKGAAAERVAAQLGLELDDAVAVGDSESDRPLLEVVADPFVMAEAPESMREKYTTVGSIEDDGVLEVLEYAAQKIYRSERDD